MDAHRLNVTAVAVVATLQAIGWWALGWWQRGRRTDPQHLVAAGLRLQLDNARAAHAADLRKANNTGERLMQQLEDERTLHAATIHHLGEANAGHQRARDRLQAVPHAWRKPVGRLATDTGSYPILDALAGSHALADWPQVIADGRPQEVAAEPGRHRRMPAPVPAYPRGGIDLADPWQETRESAAVAEVGAWCDGVRVGAELVAVEANARYEITGAVDYPRSRPPQLKTKTYPAAKAPGKSGKRKGQRNGKARRG